MEKKKIFTLRRLIVVLFIIAFGIMAYINFRGSYLEYKDLGENYLNTFLTKEKYHYMVVGVNFVFIFIIMYFTGRRIKKGLRVFFEQEKKEIPRLPNKSISLIFSSIESIFVGRIFTPNIILCISNRSFNKADPIFNLDISFFMFIEPLVKMLIMYFIFICIGIILYSFTYYVIVFNKYFDGIDKETLKQSLMMKTIYRNIRLITLGISAYILVCSVDVVFNNFLTTDSNIKLVGAGFIDSTIKFIGYILFAVILFVSICMAVKNFQKGNQSKFLKDLAIVPVYLVGLFLFMVTFDFVFVRTNEFEREKAFIEANIDRTKEAYKINTDIESIDYTGTITVEEAQANGNIINNAVVAKNEEVQEDYEVSQEGNKGLVLNFIDRLILGIKEKDIDIAFSGFVDSNSKVSINTDIIERAKLALPDVMYDEHPYKVTDEDGTVYWVIDAYTVSNSYPYSTYTNIAYNNQKRDINYIRNSIKVITNSYTGEMKFYITDSTDQIAMAYRKVYPELFQDIDTQISSTIEQQFIYPEFLFNVQATLLEEYHNTKADVLYRSGNTWEKTTYRNASNNSANKIIGNSSKKVNVLNSYYTMVKNENAEQIGLVQIFSPKGKQNIISYLIGTVKNGENELTLRTLNSDTNILGPTQLDTQIAQDETIQSQIDSLVVAGAKITRNMIVVPIENTLLYIENIYQTFVNESNLPVLRRVVAASGNKVAIGNSLQEAMDNLISTYATNIEIENTDDIKGLIESIIKANNNLSDSLNSSSWELMGTDLQRLQDLINLLEEQMKEFEKENGENESNVINDENQTNTTNTVENGNVIENLLSQNAE